MKYLINPKEITNFNCHYTELELAILFWVCVAGKNGVTAAKCLNELLTFWHDKSGLHSPFELVRFIIKNGNLPNEMKEYGIGCYTSKSKSFMDLVHKDIDLRNCSVDDLESVYGVGKKTARCFLIHSRENVRHAGLDVHCLSFLRDKGIETPKSTPIGKEYNRLENIFLDIADSVNMTPADLDLLIWNVYSGKIKDGDDVDFLNSIEYAEYKVGVGWR